MTSRITEYLQTLRTLKEALPEIENASFKISTYDRYYSQGGSQADSQDYFEVQRILEGDEASAVSLPPKASIRSDLGFIAESLCFYLERIDQVRINVKTLKGFILPGNFSPGEFRDLVEASQDGSGDSRDLYLLKSSGEKHLVHISAVRNKLSSIMDGNISEKIQELVDLSSRDRPSKFAVDQGLQNMRTLEEELIARWESGAFGPNVPVVDEIADIPQLKSYIKTIFMKGCDDEMTEEEIDEVIEVISKL